VPDRWPLPAWTWRALIAAVVLAGAGALLAPQLDEAGDAVRAAGGVAWWLIVVGTILQAAAILSQALLVRILLPASSRPSVPQVSRIELASTAASHTIPGGTVAGTALGFQLLRNTGSRTADAGFAMGVRGLGSALVLHMLLWATLLVSIPLHGFDPRYTVAALAGAALLAAIGVILLLLVHQEERTSRRLGRLLQRLPGVNEDEVGGTVTRVAERTRTLIGDRRLLMTAAGWSAAYWLLGAASLWIFLFAFGEAVPVDEMMVAFGVANVAAFLPVTPRGLGIVEVTLVSILSGFGVPGGQAALGVLAWRLVAFWAPIPVGGAAYLSLRAALR
jgi:uncharacterized protein (TIRG00374 family)